MTVRYNFIKNIYVKDNTSGNGITISGENGDTQGERTGFKIYNNIVMNTEGDGIRSNNKDPITVTNNVIFNSEDGISLEVVGGAAVRATVKNNIIASPRANFFEVGGVNNVLAWDNNLYYSDPASDAPLWKHWGSFDVWRHEMGADANSVVANPSFVSPNPSVSSDFKLKANSQAIDAGADVGLTIDFEGVPVPSKAGPDMGAFEYGTAGPRSNVGTWSAYE
jgi:hypothetical protein